MKKVGHFELVFGSMYSGKSEELIRRIKRAIYGNKKVQLFKPKIDNRYSDTAVVTHAGESLEAEIVEDVQDILALVKEDTTVVGIDEVQFFPDTIADVIETLNKKGIRVIAAGLDMYASGDAFGPMGILATKAKYVDKLHAVCVDCGENAYISHRLKKDSNLVDANKKSSVHVGSFGEYVALCETCREKH